jgi:plasmid segregation protein ParM
MTHKVGIDIGNSSIKYYSDLGFGEIPTWRARGHITQVVADSHAPLSAIRYNGEDLILGEDAVLGTNFVWKTDEEKGDDVNVPFILLALARMGITQADIVLGLPVSSAASKKKVEKAKEAYSGVKEAVVNGRSLTFNIRVNVMAEPLGTYLSLVLDENFRYVKTSPYFHDQLAIVDIGYRTVDIVILERGKLAATRNSTMSGMIRLFDKIKADLEAEHGKMRPNEEVRIHNSIVNHFGTGTLKINGEFVKPDFWKRAAGYKVQLAKDISDEIKVVLSEIRPDKIMLTGGGALLLQNELLSGNRHFVMHNNPRFANVIGFYRAAKTMPDQTGAGGSNAEHRDHISAVQSR